jgi:malate dehydrogenase
VEVDFEAEEKAMFAKSVESVQGLVSACKDIMPSLK